MRGDLFMLPGDTEVLELSFVDGAGEPIDITDWSITMQVKKKVTDPIPVLAQTVTDHEDAQSGITQLVWEADETACLEKGIYRYSLRYTDANSHTVTIISGRVIVPYVPI